MHTRTCYANQVVAHRIASGVIAKVLNGVSRGPTPAGRPIVDVALRTDRLLEHLRLMIQGSVVPWKA